MSEGKSRFRMKKGDIEIEYEGASEEVSSKFKEIFDWLRSEPMSSSQTQSRPEERTKASTEIKEPKIGKVGGVRSAVTSPAINELIEEGFLKEFKTVNQVQEELIRKTVPANLKSVQTALARKVPKVLDRVKGNDGKWVYRKKL